MTGALDITGRSDRELVLAFQAGNDAAFDELYRRHHDRVARVCYRFMNNSPDAEEATQESFLKAFQALPRFNGQFQVGAWLARIAANVCVDNLRVKSRTHLVALPNEERTVLVEDGPEDIVVGDHPELDIAIQDIQPLHANALKMRALDGLSHVEMAGRLDMTPSQVKALLHRARSSFKKAWNKAQGWLIAPILGARSLDRSSHVSHTSSNLAALSVHAPALAEKAAASVLIVMVALSNAPSGFSSAHPEPGHAARPAIERAPNDRTELRPEQRVVEAVEQHRAPGAADATIVEVVEEELPLPDVLTSTIEGTREGRTDEDGGPEERNESGGDIVPPTVKDRPKETADLIKETLGSLDD